MKRALFLIIIPLIVGCGPNESDYKSTIPALEDRVTKTTIDPQSDPPSDSEYPQKTHKRPTKDPQSDPQQVVSYSAPPATINQNVTFFPQAPDADWGMPWQEACEEASAVLAYYYVADKPLTKDLFKSEVNGLVEWQNKKFGDYKHTTIQQTAEMINGYFGYENFEIIENPTIEDMKKELADLNVIIAPFAGRQLGNPFYSGQGPLYHMMLIKGYDEENFITNDVGTKRGENFIYPYATIMNTMHDWHDTDINLGSQKVIILR